MPLPQNTKPSFKPPLSSHYKFIQTPSSVDSINVRVAGRSWLEIEGPGRIALAAAVGLKKQLEWFPLPVSTPPQHFLP